MYSKRKRKTNVNNNVKKQKIKDTNGDILDINCNVNAGKEKKGKCGN